ncbi:MAG TPA: type II secretion system F family protein [Acidimicrobiales bacterium]|nr:type II secretion system F family protein [Acidimicrobiales bacterium]
MTGALLGAAWAALAASAVLGRRPPRRLQALRGAAGPASAPRRRGSGPGVRTVAAAAVGALVVLPVAPPLAPVIVAAAWAVPWYRARAAERHRLERLEAGLPDVVDLLLLAVGAGCNVPQAVAAAGRRGLGPVAGELERVAGEVRRGRRLADALDELPGRAGEPLRGLAGVLAACERYGVPTQPALTRLADDVRRRRRHQAEAAARRLPIVLLFPLVLCILPAFALLTVAPLVAGALRELRL